MPRYRAIILMGLAITVGWSLSERDQSIKRVGIESRPTSQPVKLSLQAPEISPGEVFSEYDILSLDGYVIQKRRRSVREESQGDLRSSLRIDVTYAVLKRGGRILARFDDNIYFGAGNSTRFGTLAILGGGPHQVLVSQDRFRGGTQWVINLSATPRVIFDGPKWGVGREGDDMRIVDLDQDGVFEIIVPITDFYSFQDKLPIARIPLPLIVFKYDRGTKKYVPANPLFDTYALPRDRELGKTALGQLLALIYAGKESQAWDIYDISYRLGDKEELRRRVKAILVRQPVYKFIYNPRIHK